MTVSLDAPPVLEVRSVAKHFGGVRALAGVSLTVRAGRVHALLGENGAGKSTLVNCLSGVLTPDSGQVLIDGAPVTLDKPPMAQRHGIRTIHQELDLAGALSVAENVLLGRLPGRRGVYRRRRAGLDADEALRRLGVDLPHHAVVATLEVADQQLVEIARALIGEARVLIMDEPTAALPPGRIEDLLRLVRRLTDDGVAVVYVSHRLDEVLAIADDISVLRNGCLAATLEPSTTTKADLIRAIVGRDVTESLPSAEIPVTARAAISLSGVSAGVVQDLTAHATPGEVVGFFGLLGAGQQTVAELLYGLGRPRDGEVDILGVSGLPRSAHDAVRRGIGFVPGDRKAAGLAVALSITENLFLGSPGRGRWGLIRPRRDRAAAGRHIRAAGVVAASPGQAVGQLSGGNQQKVVIARWSARDDIQVLLLEEPTRGVDVGAKSEIHHRLRDWAATGRSVLLFSADPEEVVALCDRVYVLAHGRQVAELRGPDLTEDALTAAALAG